ncbi:MAG: hypothetical protein QNK23_12225 [Crocinitomicaceae bacterium]|nr:hypothetical protein [Crocinitomicaceae bacterium]
MGIKGIDTKLSAVLGLITLMILVSNVRDSFASFSLQIAHMSITIDQFYLITVATLSLSLYSFVIVNIVQNTDYGSFRIFSWIHSLGVYTFVIVLCSPLILSILYGVHWLGVFSSLSKKNALIVIVVIGGLLMLLLLLIIIVFSRMYGNRMREKEIEMLKLQEMKVFEDVLKFYETEYYSHAVISTIDVVEVRIKRLLLEREIWVGSSYYIQMRALALKHGVLLETDIPYLDGLLALRNSAVHLESVHSKKEAGYAIEFIQNWMGVAKDKEKQT